MSQALQTVIDDAWEQRTTLSAAAAPAEVRDAVNHIIDQLDSRQAARGREDRRPVG
jgi:2,3,4,5-tetrahydropyridine-2-carboxylate N-succinyltransferase